MLVEQAFARRPRRKFIYYLFIHCQNPMTFPDRAKEVILQILQHNKSNGMLDWCSKIRNGEVHGYYYLTRYEYQSICINLPRAASIREKLRKVHPFRLYVSV